MLDLILNKREYLTESEKKLAQQIEVAKEAGKEIYIPYDN